MAKRLNKNELRDKFLFEAGLKVEQIQIKIRDWDSFVVNTRELFSGDKNGDMRIIYPTLHGHTQRFNDSGKWTETYRIRKLIPFLNKQGKLTKYVMAPNSNICAFFPPEMLQAFSRKTQIDTLIVTEGEKKAFIACKNGFDCIGISGIWAFKDKDDKDNQEQGELLAEIKEFIKVCGVRRVVLLHDNDALDMTDVSGSKTSEPLTSRPLKFCNSAKYFCQLIFQEGVKFSYSYINPHLSTDGEKYGLDDLILKYSAEVPFIAKDLFEKDGAPVTIPCNNILLDFYNSLSEGKRSSYFVTKNITQIKEVYFKDIFLLNDPKEFYAYHKSKIGAATEFRFHNQKFKINVDGSLEEIKTRERDLVWVNEGCYVGEDQKGHPRTFTNFVMKPLFLLKRGAVPKRVIYFENVLGQTALKELTMDDLVSVTNFRKVLISEGTFIYKGDQFELLNLQQILFRDEKVALELNSLGWQKYYGFYAFANGLTVAGKFYPVDEYGIVSWENQLFYLPAFSSIHHETDDRYENDRKFKHFAEHEISFEDWANAFIKAYHANGIMGICFFIAALFRDLIYGKYNEFPILNLFGQKGTGKSTMAKSLMAMLGVPPTPINIEAGSTTMKGLQRKFAQFKNALVWIDEFKNDIDRKQVGALKGLYDGTGYERAQTSQDNKTMSTPVTSSTILSGQDMPTVDAALMSRVLLGMFAKNQFKAEEGIAMAALKELEKKGLTCVSVYILGHRSLIEAHYATELKYWIDYFTEHYKKVEILDRLWKNVAYVLSPICILLDHQIIDGKKTGLSRESLKSTFLEIIERHRTLMNTNQEKSVFWEMVETLFEEGLISVEKGHFRFDQDSIAIRYTPIYSAYAEKFRRVYGKPGMDKNTLLNYLKNSAEFIEEKSSIRFEGINTNGYLFKYKQLGINLVKLTPNDQITTSEHVLPSQREAIHVGDTDDLPY